MAKSMTAFSRVERRDGLGELVWELRSVNHRYLELFVRLPEDLRALEPAVRERARASLGRGKVECLLRYRPAPDAGGELQLSTGQLEQLADLMEKVAARLPRARQPDLLQLLNWPGLVQSGETDPGPLQQAALALFDQALDGLVATREREGARLAELVLDRCGQLDALVEKARRRMPLVIDNVRQRLRARLEEVSRDLDPERLEQEMALLAQRLDVDEEMDRLATHLDEVRRVLKLEQPVGRRLDFLMQELNREANTLGSKSADAGTSAISVEMKVLIEQMREQIQNIE